ncbi:MAG: DeoR/GlpR family DNA-binding transcription regulator [Terriglobia bacterium]|jgi:DeoR/GlpR family transcriptional regulator of sugar metabolism
MQNPSTILFTRVRCCTNKAFLVKPISLRARTEQKIKRRYCGCELKKNLTFSQFLKNYGFVFAAERKLRIREILSAERTVSASELAEVLGVTSATVRRDLAALESEGLLVRSHGGAVSHISSTAYQGSYDYLLGVNKAEKAAIARKAAELILDGDTVFLEGSTTVFELARCLRRRSRLNVVTNSPAIVLQFQHSPGVSVISTGGQLIKEILYLGGTWTRRALSEVRLDKAVLGLSAIDPSYGMSAADHAEAEIKQLLIKAARQRIGVGDHTKFSKQSFAFVGPVTDLHILVTDSGVGQEYVEQLREKGIQVLIASAQPQNPSTSEQNQKK